MEQMMNSIINNKDIIFAIFFAFTLYYVFRTTDKREARYVEYQDKYYIQFKTDLEFIKDKLEKETDKNGEIIEKLNEIILKLDKKEGE